MTDNERRIVDSHVVDRLKGFCQRALDNPPDSNPDTIPYDHIRRIIATGIYGAATTGKPEEIQIKSARDTALQQLQKFGPAIIPFLKEELRGVLTEEDLA